MNEIQDRQNTLIDACNLALIRGERRLFASLNFTLVCGQAIHLRGRNGSGKTSLFKILTGALTPTVGTLNIFGKQVQEFESEDYQNMIYLGHQTAIKHDLTVAENLSLNAQLFDQLPVSAEALHCALETVGLRTFRDQLAGKLSAGQKRRIMLARLWVALSGEQGDIKTQKQLWLLDEPLTALDDDFIDILQNHITTHLALGGGIIFTSHQALKLDLKVATLDLGYFE